MAAVSASHVQIIGMLSVSHLVLIGTAAVASLGLPVFFLYDMLQPTAHGSRAAFERSVHVAALLGVPGGYRANGVAKKGST